MYLRSYLGLSDHLCKVNSVLSGISRVSNINNLNEYLVFLLVMCVAGGLLVESEEFSEFTQREVTFHVLLLIYHTAAQSFLMGLPLQDLLLDCPCL